MILDQQTLFSHAQAITADTASDHVVDLGHNGDIAKGTPVKLLVQVVEDFNNLTSLNVTIETDDNSNFSSSEALLMSGDISLSELKAGYVFAMDHLPRGNKRYLRLSYDITGTAPTAGKVTAGLVADHQSNGQ